MLVNVTSAMLGFAVSAASPSSDFANEIGTPMMIILILFGGFYVSIKSLPVVANLIPYLSTFRWGFQALAVNEFRGLTFSCESDNQSECILTGEEALATIDFEGKRISDACFGLSMVLLGFLFLAFLILDRSKITFTHLGYTGRKYASCETTWQQGDNDSDRKPSSNVGSGGGRYEMVPAV